MTIGGVDKETTRKNIENIKRRSRSPRSKEPLPQENLGERLFSSSESQDKSTEDESTESEINIPVKKNRTDPTELEAGPSSGQMRMQLPNVATICARTGMPIRQAAMIVTATLVDANLITESDKSKVVDRHYLKRQKKKMLADLKKEEEGSSRSIDALYYDGRKDETVKLKTEGKRTYQSRVSEEHIVLIEEPGSLYLGFVAPISGSAVNISSAILDFLKRKNINVSNLSTIGCGGTNTNTGNQGGIIRLTECHLKRPLQWSVCLLHGNELPLKYFIIEVDGATKGPYSFSRPIGSALKKCHTLPIVAFEPIPTILEPDFLEGASLSTDQEYLNEMSCAVSAGFCSESLAKKTPGKVVHSRWLTTACRILRLYVATENPSENLVNLVTYIQRVYVPAWFHIKKYHSISDGAKNLYKIISWSRYLPEKFKSVIDPVIQRNGYYGHPENILVAMIADEREEVRTDAWMKIADARKREKIEKARKSQRKKKKEEKLRIFQIPAFNFDAPDYTLLIDWNEVNITVPPVLSKLTDEDFRKFILEGATFEFKFPCHTQAVERHIKEVTQASLSFATDEERHYEIKKRLESRRQMPTFNTKRQFKF